MTQPGKIHWGRRFLAALELAGETGRPPRGRPLASAKRAPRWRIRGTRIEATARGEVNPYLGGREPPVYEIRIEFTAIPDSAWNEAIRHVGEKAGFVCRLLFNEMPEEIETPLLASGVSLLPRGRGDLRTSCSCEDRENPCRHVAELLGQLARRLDRDPLLLFELRGLSRGELIRRLRATPLGSALAAALTEEAAELRPAESYFTRPLPLALPESVAPAEFWRGGRRLPAGVESPPPAAVAGILIRKGGDHPAFWDQDGSFVEAMDALYEQVRKKAKDWL